MKELFPGFGEMLVFKTQEIKSLFIYVLSQSCLYIVGLCSSVSLLCVRCYWTLLYQSELTESKLPNDQLLLYV